MHKLILFLISVFQRNKSQLIQKITNIIDIHKMHDIIFVNITLKNNLIY